MKNLFFCLISFILLVVISACGGDTPRAEKDKDQNAPAAAGPRTRNIVFFGNSITAGYGVDPSEAYPALIQKKIDSLDLPYTVVNAGVSGETSAAGASRVDWVLKQPLDVFVLELGGNDGLRGIPVHETKKNLQSIIDKVKAKYPQATIILAGMQIPPNMGQAYTGSFREIYADIARSSNVKLIPFILEGVGGVRDLNQPDGIHPTPAGHQLVATTVWQALRPAITSTPGS